MAGTESNKSSGNQLIFLDGLRGLAALVVMVGHARWLLWEGYSEGYLKHPEIYSIPEKALVYIFSIFRYGHEAVLFFFVLSGFVIHLKYSLRLASDKSSEFNLMDYFRRRIRRIYPPFLFILLFTFLLDKTGTYLGFSIYFQQTPNALINENIHSNLSLINLVGNLFFIESSLVRIWGSDSPLWSLKFEWWFYCLYPLLIIVNKKFVGVSFLVVVILFICSIFIYPYFPSFFISVFGYLLSWWLGVMLADIYSRRLKISFAYLAPLSLLIPALILWAKHIDIVVISDTLWAFGFLGILSIFFLTIENGIRWKRIENLKWLGDSSYTLYIMHFPLLVFLNGVLLRISSNVMPVSQLYFITVAFFIVILSYKSYRFIERPFYLQGEKKRLLSESVKKF